MGLYRLLLAVLWSVQGVIPLSITEPLFPPNARGGGTAVFAVRITAGKAAEVTELYGQEPFSSSGSQALSEWKFPPDASVATLVVVCYRRPEFLITGTATQELSPSRLEPELPFPQVVVEPEYPPNTTAQGSVVLNLEIARDGSLGQVEVIKPVGALTQAAIQAVRKWRFTPARDKKGNAVESQVFAVLVFRAPLMVPTRITPGQAFESTNSATSYLVGDNADRS